MFQDLAKDTGKGNGTVVYSLGFVTFFEHWGDKSMTPALNSSMVLDETTEEGRLFHIGIVLGKKEFFRASL